MANLNEILGIFAKHVVWQDEGDRRTVAEFLNRDPDATDTFTAPYSEKPEQTDSDEDQDKNEDQSKSNDPVKPTPATMRQNARK